MADKPLQREDIARYLLRRGVSLDEFANELIYLQCHGVPLDKVGLVGRAWQLVSEMLDEKKALDLAERYTLLTCCPHCQSDTRITGGRKPCIYCPNCGAVREDTQVYCNRTWYRWSQSERPFVRVTKRNISQTYPKVKQGGRGG
jgi:hypothetical protein